jgi:hypothetical protein
MLSSQGDGTGTIEQAAAGVSITGATTADPVVCTATSHGYSDGDLLFIDGATGTTEINGLRYVANKDTNTFELTDLAGTAIGSAGTFGGTVDSNLAFHIAPAAGKIYDIVRLNVAAGDGSAWVVGGMLGVAALTNGIILAVYRGNTLRKTITPMPIKGWSDWAMIAGSDVSTIADNTANKVEAAVRATFSKSENPIHLDGDQSDIFVMYTQDDLDGLTFIHAAVQGADDTIPE